MTTQEYMAWHNSYCIALASFAVHNLRDQGFIHLSFDQIQATKAFQPINQDVIVSYFIAQFHATEYTWTSIIDEVDVPVTWWDHLKLSMPTWMVRLLGQPKMRSIITHLQRDAKVCPHLPSADIKKHLTWLKED